MLSLTGIVLSLILLMFLAYRGHSVLILAPVLAMLAVLFSAPPNELLGTYTQVFMQGMGGFAVKFFPVFLLGAVFGKLMEDSGAAHTIAYALVKRLGRQQALLAIALSSAILTYGGVSVFVVTFAVFPIAAALFREIDIPKRLIPGAIAIGSLTFTMTALPGSPAIQNAIPMPYFQTDAFAAPGLGLVASLIMFTGAVWWMKGRLKRALAAGEGYGDHHDSHIKEQDFKHLPPLWGAVAPIVLVIFLNYVLTKFMLPAMDTAYLAEKKFGGVSLNSVAGLWAIIAALAGGCLLLVFANMKYWRNLKKSVNDGAMGSLLPIFNTASEVGYGTVIATLAGFVILRDFLLGLSPGNPLVSEAIVINVMAGITGSASGGMSIALSAMGETYMQLAAQFGISPELMHRVASIASGGLDALPHNGAVITMLTICGLTHKESYLDIFVVCVVVPLAALAAVLVLGTVFGSF
ncbi:GntP family permease [Neisseria animalis]|uniref:GntP family permease n=1 Tax=Neisseria animalis TaxID=492 RepID=A0A5P3MPY7_NEIAN|nr:GntP family permease [Neisseria animalis]QEY23480.1 GntP family permease [Neisseria animalis]ROW33327.1 GntP family permease [Neisseria animalis]VEE09039.1 low affinity gluconate transporter [Neisseria animalis]